MVASACHWFGVAMITAVDVLVVEDAAQVLNEAGLERRDILQPGVVDALVGEIGVDVAQRLDLDVGDACEAALQGVALAADADAGDHDLVVGANDAARHRRRRADPSRREKVVARDKGRGGNPAHPRRKRPPGHRILVFWITGHGHLLQRQQSYPRRTTSLRHSTCLACPAVRKLGQIARSSGTSTTGSRACPDRSLRLFARHTVHVIVPVRRHARTVVSRAFRPGGW